jgi:hypothetical protein
MMRCNILVVLMFMILFLNACQYKKGDMYVSTSQTDSLQYLILDRGKGKNLSEKAAQLKLRHEYKGNVCQVKYLSDSAAFENQKGLLLFNAALPNIDNDILTKGFFGSFTTKEIVVYVLVSYPDLEKNFRKREEE